MKDIFGFEGIYSITEDGKVWSYRNKRFLKTIINKNGYTYVKLSKDGISRYHRVHRLVAIAYLPNPNNLPQVNHIDENLQNNSVSNLEWCSCGYNINYGARNETVRKKLSKAVLCVELNKIYSSATEAATELNISISGICNCAAGRRTTAGGYHWKYL